MVPLETRCFSTSQTIRMTKSGAVVAKKVALATVVLRIARCQKNRSPEKARPASTVAPRIGAPRRARGRTLLLDHHPGIDNRQGERDAPERAGEGSHIGGGEAHEDGRDAHGDGADAQGQEGRSEGSIPVDRSSAWRTWENFRRTSAGAGQGCPVALSVVLGHVKALPQPLSSAPSPIMSAPLARPRPDLSPRPCGRVAGSSSRGRWSTSTAIGRRRACCCCATMPPTRSRPTWRISVPAESQFERHIAYDIGAAAVTRALARRLGAPAILTRFSRLVIDPNRGRDDPTLVMQLSDGAVVPGNAGLSEEEIQRPNRALLRSLRRGDRAGDPERAQGRPSAGDRDDPQLHPELARLASPLACGHSLGRGRALCQAAPGGAHGRNRARGRR